MTLLYGVSFAWQIGFLTIVVILGFMGGGLLLDRWLHTTPFFIILGSILGLTVSLYELRQMIKPLLEKSKEEVEEKKEETKDQAKQ